MLKALVFAAVMAIPLAASATTKSELCPQVGDLAAAVMEARQSNASLSQVMAVADAQEPPIDELMREMIIAAYRVPLFMTQEYRDNAIANFRNSAELSCYGSEV